MPSRHLSPIDASGASTISTSETVDMHWAFEQSPDCVKIMDGNGAVLAMNVNGQCAMEIDDFSQMAGRTWTHMWPEDGQAAVLRALAAAREGSTGHFNAFCPTTKGTPKWWDVVVTPIRGDDGGVHSLLAVSRDITALHLATEQRLQLAARLEFTMEAAEFGEWHWDEPAGKIIGNLRHDQCFGYQEPVREWTQQMLLEHVHPDDQAMVASAMADAASSTSLRFECRVIWPDRTVHWIGVQGSHFATPGKSTEMIGLIADITERMQTTEALHTASRKKDEFLAMLAHELRNPLAPISAAAQVITGGRANPAALAKAGAIIARQSQHMSHLLDDLLDVARVTQGLVTLNMARVDLADVIMHAVEQVRPLVERCRHELAVTLAPGKTEVSGDSQRLMQVVVNLLNNAARYTPPNGKLAITMTADAACAHITVVDNGIGMAPATLRHAFELFSQAARSSDRANGGLGLGLALVKGLVERHGGSVAGASDGLNCGSQFTVTLPLLAQEGVSAPAPGASVLPVRGQLRLLIVDDNRDAADTLAMYLDILGHTTHVAYSASDAIAQAAQLAPDACLLDVGLPDMSGHVLARRLGALPGCSNAVLIAITGYGSASDREESASAGFHHHLTKPVDLGALEALLATIG
ncbi:MAG: ATP-binding protein [Pseudomonadota bacterium]|nr:ATP-binding protein [Pseudomonadota bacterium]